MTIRECPGRLDRPGVLDQIESFRQEAKRGPLHPAQFQMLKIFAKQGFPRAQELLQKRAQIGVKKQKRFAEIVKETLRQEGEASLPWMRRILDECTKYDTNVPTIISEELLEKLSR